MTLSLSNIGTPSGLVILSIRLAVFTVSPITVIWRFPGWPMRPRKMSATAAELFRQHTLLNKSDADAGDLPAGADQTRVYTEGQRQAQAAGHLDRAGPGLHDSSDAGAGADL
jgi:hypothetical protein